MHQSEVITTINGAKKATKDNEDEASQTKISPEPNESVTDKETVANHNQSPTLPSKFKLAQINQPKARSNEKMDKHTEMLNHEFNWLKTVLNARTNGYLNDLPIQITDYSPPPINQQSRYGAFIHQHKLNPQQRLVVCMALATVISPNIFDVLHTKNTLYNIPFTEFGGIVNSGETANQGNTGFTPTIQTALFIFAGENLQQYLDAKALFNSDAKLYTSEILESPSVNDDFHLMRTPLKLTSNSIDHILQGKKNEPQYNPDFPAKRLTTQLEWEDLVLVEETENHLQELMLWLKHSKVLNEDWAACPEASGYKALFYGPPGTGKTMTATLLAKKLNRPIYRIDLSQIISKYIGETEKNLEKIFLHAEQKDWILFFDEAESLFGQRSSVSNANDRHANQQTAYLLQRIETCQNLVILASNIKDNIDAAFLRRFQSMIHFSKPDAAQREQLWHKGFSIKANLSHINIPDLAKKYELTGAEIKNVIRFASLKAIDKGDGLIHLNDIITAIRREKFKEGKFV